MSAARRSQPLLFAAAWLAAAAGCVSRDAVYRDVRASRAASLQRWRAARVAREPKETLSGPLTLAQSIDVAVANNKGLMAAMQDKEKAKGRILAAWSNALPHLDGVASYTRLKDVGGFTVAGRQVKLGDKDNYAYGLRLEQPLFTGGATAAAIRAAKIYACLSDETVKAEVQRVIFETRRAYYDALLAKVLLEVAQSAVRSARSHLEDVRKKLEQGVAMRFDLLRAKVELSNWEALAIKNKNDLHLAMTRLLKVLGVSQDSRVTLTDELRYEPVKADLSDAVRRAFLERPELYQAELGARMQEQALKVARSGWFPHVSAFVEYERAKPNPVDPTINEWDDQLSGGVAARVPLFDGLHTLGRVREAKAELKKKQILLRNAEESVLLEVRQAVLSLRDADELVQSQKANLERAKEGLRLVEVGYRNGVNTQVELLDARSALTRAEGLYYQAIYAHMLAKLMLEKATGALQPPAPAKETRP